jgi:hypothetical protein
MGGQGQRAVWFVAAPVRLVERLSALSNPVGKNGWLHRSAQGREMLVPENTPGHDYAAILIRRHRLQCVRDPDVHAVQPPSQKEGEGMGTEG